jgi:hypothetical protein
MNVNRPVPARGISVEEDFRRLDVIPRPIAEVYRRAPINQGLPTIEMVRKHGVAKARAIAISSCAKRAIIELRKAYGDDHPCLPRLQKAMAIGQEMAR